MEKIIISNPENVEEIKKKIISEGKEKFHVLADFDGTLTYDHNEKGKLYPSLISVLRDGDYISKDYAEKAHELANKYRPKEKDESLPLAERKQAMTNWWNEHFDLLIKSGLNEKHLEDIANSGIIKLRKGSRELIDYLHEEKIPLVIISSSGIGEAIKIYLEKEKLMHDNIYLITNLFKWNERGNATKIIKPVIHSMNKDETVVKNFPKIYEKIKDRKNVLMLGNSLGDLEMITGFDYENLLKMGFLNEDVEKRIENYKQKWDVVITNDSNADFVFDLIKEIK